MSQIHAHLPARFDHVGSFLRPKFLLEAREKKAKGEINAAELRKVEDKAITDRVGVVFPNQSSWGTHVNVAGGAMAKNAKNPDNAVKFLEYLASPAAQEHFANGNNEWPIAKGVMISNPALQAMSGGNFKRENVPVSVIGMNQIKVQQMLDRVGFK